MVPRTLKNVNVTRFHIKYDYTDLGFVIGYYTDEKDSKEYAMVIGNLTLRPHQFTQANVSNPDFDGFSVGIIIESRKIDETIDRIFSHFKESFKSTVLTFIALLSGLTFFAALIMISLLVKYEVNPL
jgi:hypothetical protein